MKRIKFFITLIFLFLGSYIFSQPVLTDSSEVYNYWTKRATIEFIYAYMEDYCEVVDSAKIADEDTQGKINYQSQFIKNIDQKSVAEIDNDYDSIPSFLNENNWKNTLADLFQPLKKQLDTQVPLNNGFFTTYKPNGNILSISITGYEGCQMTYCDSLKEEVISKYNANLESLYSRGNYRNERELKNNAESRSYTTVERATSFFGEFGKFLLYILFFIAGAIISFIVSKAFFATVFEDCEEKYKGDIRKLKELHYSKIRNLDSNKNFENKSDSSYSELLKSNLKLRNDNKQLLTQLDQFGQSNSNKPDLIEEIPTKSTENEIDTLAQAEQKVSLYFNIPEPDGSFSMDYSSLSSKERSLYKIEYMKGHLIGELSFLTGKLDMRAINRKDSTLEPVCDIENIENINNASKIMLIQNGKVKLISNKWVIIQEEKIKIKLV